ncbi:MAG: putative quinol monooxygenase [Burkholderiaceae bacterium]
MFVVTVQFSIHPTHSAAFLREMVANARNSREREPGCVAFDVCEDPAQAGQVFLYEIYTDAAAFEQHKREAHFLEFDKVVAPWVSHKSVKILALVDR